MKYKRTLGSFALSGLLLLGMSGCNGSNSTETVVETISPYQRVAVISGTWADVNGIADKIAQYVTLTDEDGAPLPEPEEKFEPEESPSEPVLTPEPKSTIDPEYEPIEDDTEPVSESVSEEE